MSSSKGMDSFRKTKLNISSSNKIEYSLNKFKKSTCSPQSQTMTNKDNFKAPQIILNNLNTEILLHNQSPKSNIPVVAKQTTLTNKPVQITTSTSASNIQKPSHKRKEF